jgi:hypothetical protein
MARLWSKLHRLLSAYPVYLPPHQQVDLRPLCPDQAAPSCGSRQRPGLPLRPPALPHLGSDQQLTRRQLGAGTLGILVQNG